jgi:dCMP deaminase
MNPHFRPTWDDYFMALARIVSTRATCDRLHAGAVLVKDHRIVSTGYNGAPPGLGHCDEDGHLLEDGHCVRTIHAEHNALLQAAVIGGASTKGATLYALYSPCIHCAKYVAAAGVKRIVIGKMYRNEDVVAYLKNAEVEVSLYMPAEGLNTHISKMFTHDIDERAEKAVKLEERK